MLTKNLLDGFGTLAAIVEGNTRHKVVQNMSLNNVMEDVLANEAKVTINSGSGTTGKVPLSNIVVRKSRVRVLQVSDEHEPVVNPEVGHKVVQRHGGETPLLNRQVDESHGDQDTNIRNNDIHEVLLVKNRRDREEVVDNHLGSVRVLLASDVGEEVHNPAKELLEKNVPKSKDGGVLGSLGDVSNGKELLLGLGNKNHISLKVTSGLVMLTMRNSPGVVGDKKSRMKDPADNIINSLRVTEGTMTALVSQNPAAGTKKTLYKAIDNPSNNSKRNPGDQMEVGMGSVGKETNKKHISSNIREGLDVRALITLRRNRVKNLLNGELGNDKGLTVGVDRGLDGTVVLVELVVSAETIEVGLGATLSEGASDGLGHNGREG